MPEIAAQVGHHRVQTEAVFDPFVHTPYYKRMSETMYRWLFIRDLRYSCCFPKLIKLPVNTGFGDMAFRVFAREKPFAGSTQNGNQPCIVCPAEKTHVLRHMNKTVFITFRMENGNNAGICVYVSGL